MMKQVMGSDASGRQGRPWLALAMVATAFGSIATIGQASAQGVPPDAGQTLEQLRPAPASPAPVSELRVELPRDGQVEPGGDRVEVDRIVIQGNTAFDRETLLAAVGDPEGAAYDLAGIQGIAIALSAYYRENGYPFARALVPPQTMTEGVLNVVVVEGRYGDVSITDDNARRAAQAEAFLGNLITGDLIRARPLERTTLLLEDLPGIRVLPVLQPGEAVGTGNLALVIQPGQTMRGTVSLDNHGNRYTGYERGQVGLTLDSPFRLGDQVTINALYTDEKLGLGNLGYSRPLGGNGLRVNSSYTYTEYRLGREFAGLGSGHARVYSLGLSYPLVRTQQTNVTLTANAQYKDLYNDRLESTLIEDYSSVVFPMSVQFDHRDEWIAGGVTFGSLGINPGRLRLSGSMREVDALGTDGSFTVMNLDLARLQVLTRSLTVYGRLSAQWSAGNLDSSEGISLGGADRVRAYPTSEASGDRGGYAQLELRYTAGAFSPYLFADVGWVEFDADALDDAEETDRDLSGYGFGVRVQQREGLNLNAAVAFRLSGGAARSDIRDRDPLGWLSAAYRF